MRNVTGLHRTPRNRSVIQGCNYRYSFYFDKALIIPVFSGCGDSVARCYAGKSGTLVRGFKGHQGAINAIQVNNSRM